MSQGTKRPKGQNVPRDKQSQGTKRPKGQNVPRDKTAQGQIVPRDKTSQGTKRPRDKPSLGTNRPQERFVPGNLCLGTFCLWTFCPLGRFVLGRFVCAFCQDSWIRRFDLDPDPGSINIFISWKFDLDPDTGSINIFFKQAIASQYFIIFAWFFYILFIIVSYFGSGSKFWKVSAIRLMPLANPRSGSAINVCESISLQEAVY